MPCFTWDVVLGDGTILETLDFVSAILVGCFGEKDEMAALVLVAGVVVMLLSALLLPLLAVFGAGLAAAGAAFSDEAGFMSLK